MSTGAYAFLYFGDTEQLLPAIDTVQAMPAVTAWHAVDGHYHLVLTIDENGDALREQLNALPGLDKMLFCPVQKEISGGFTLETDSCYAWLTMEVDAEKSGAAQAAFEAFPDSVFRVLAFGEFGAVAVIEGATFEALDKIVDRDIRPLDGVLRVKRDRIIDLTQL